MKHTFITLLMLFMPIWITIVFANKKMEIKEIEKMIILKFYYSHKSENYERNKRTIAFVPIKASYDNTNLYLNSQIQMDNVTIKIKNEWKNIVYEMCITLYSNEEYTLPIHLSNGNYTLEIVNENICYYGDFEI